MAFMLRIGNAMAAKMRAATQSFQAARLCQNTAVWRCGFFGCSTREVDHFFKTFSVGVNVGISGFLVPVVINQGVNQVVTLKLYQVGDSMFSTSRAVF